MGKSKPYLDGVEHLIIADPMAQLAAFRAGDGNLLRMVKPKYAVELTAMGYEIATTQGIVKGLCGDSRHPKSPFADKRVREAMDYAIDKKAIADALGFGF